MQALIRDEYCAARRSRIAVWDFSRTREVRRVVDLLKRQ